MALAKENLFILFEDISNAICLLSNDTTPIFINQRFKKTFGFSSVNQLIEAGGLSKLIHNQEDFQFIISYAKKQRHEGIVELEDGKGKSSKCKLIASPFYITHQGKPDGIVLLFKKRYKNTESYHLNLLKTFAKNAQDAVMITEASPIDEPGPRIVYVNNAFTRMSGYESKEIIGRSPRMLQGIKTDRTERDKIRRALTERTNVEAALINYRKDGSEFWVNFTIFPYFVEDRISYFISVQRETTISKNATVLPSSVINSLPAKMAIINASGEIILTNEDWNKFGRENASMLIGASPGTNYREICNQLNEVDEKTCRQISGGLKAVMDGKQEIFTFEYAFNTIAKEMWFRLLISPINKDYPTDIVVLHVEITTRVLIEQKLQQSEQYYKSLFENHPDPICTLDLNGKFTSINHALARFIEVPKEQLLNIPFTELLYPGTQLQRTSHFEEACSGKAQNYDTTIKLFDGREVTLNITFIPIRVRGEMQGVYCILKDITASRRTQKLLVESSKRVTTILESITDGFYATDKDFKVTYWNKEAERLLGKNREEVLGNDLWTLFPEAFKLNYYKEYQKALDQNVAVHFEEYYPPLQVWTEVHAYPSREGLSVFFRDINERKQWLEELQQHSKELEKTNNELDQFVYRASHDLRAPLVSILGLINIFRLEESSEKKNEYLDLMVKSINRLDKFIQDIIFYSKNSRTELILSEVSFHSLVEEAIENVKYMEEAKKIDIIKDIADVHAFYSDHSRLSVAINNIITNAIRYHDYRKENQYIKVSVRGGEHKAKIMIEDNGQGIPEKDQNKVFEMFYRASMKTVGSGLGLYIVHENIKKLRGNVYLKSKLGVGTTFVLEIPNLKI